MDENIHDIEDFFRSQLDSLLHDPSIETWEKLTARLDKEAAEKYKRKFYIISYVSIFLMLLLIILVGVNIMYMKQHRIDQRIITATGVPVVTPGKQETIGHTGNGQRSHFQLDDLDTLNSRRNLLLVNAAHPYFKNPASSEFIRGKTLQQTPLVGVVTKPTASAFQQLYASKKIMSSKYKARGSDYIGEHKSGSQARNRNLSGAGSLDTSESRKMLLRRNIIKADLFPFSYARHFEVKAPSHSQVYNYSMIKLTRFKPFWSVIIYSSRDWTDYNLEDDEREQARPATHDDKMDIKHREEHGPSFSAGILGTYQFRKHLSIQSGLIYQHSNISIQPGNIYASTQSNGATGFKYNVSSGYVYVKPGFDRNPTPGDSLLASEAQHQLNYITIPAVVQYTWKLGRISATAGAGITANFLTGASIHAEVEDGIHREEVKIDRIYGIRDFYAGVVVKGSVNYEITHSLGIGIFPAFNYAWVPITDKNVVKTYPFSTGLGLGITYRPK